MATKLLNHVYKKATEASLAAAQAPPPAAPTAAASAKASKDKKDKGKGKAAETASVPQAPAPPAPILKCIFVHVQTSMEDSKAFWEQQGFKEQEVIKEYYKKDIEGPRDAWLLEKEIELDI